MATNLKLPILTYTTTKKKTLHTVLILSKTPASLYPTLPSLSTPSNVPPLPPPAPRQRSTSKSSQKPRRPLTITTQTRQSQFTSYPPHPLRRRTRHWQKQQQQQQPVRLHTDTNGRKTRAHKKTKSRGYSPRCPHAQIFTQTLQWTAMTTTTTTTMQRQAAYRPATRHLVPGRRGCFSRV